MPRYTPKDLYEMYRQGFSGCLFEQHIYDELIETSKYAYFKDGARKTKNSGKGKLSTPYKSVLKFDKNPYNERQTTGDCQNGSDLVLMADGSSKQIKDIKIGEYVISAFGKKRKIVNTFKKPYHKKMVELTLSNHTKIASTPDHKYIVDNISMQTKAIGLLEIGDSVFMPQIDFEEQHSFDMANFYNGEIVDENTNFKKLTLEPVEQGYIRAKAGRCPIKRHVKLDAKLCWLLGLYAAEGGIDGVDGKIERITFNLGGHEALIAEQVRLYVKEIFDIDAHIYQVPSKPTVIYARINSVFVANLFKYLISGNTYTKSLGKELFVTTKKNKLALLKGWIDGDGHNGRYQITATSVSKNLVLDFSKIANDVNLNFSIYRQDMSHDETRKDSYTIRFNAQSSKHIACKKTKYVTDISLKNTIGCMLKITDINIVEPEENFVYCIEVEKDHNFICKGIGINNCVSHATRNACDVSRAVEIDVHRDREAWLARGATEAIYGARGHGGQGMSCSRAATFVSQVGGIVVRKNYPNVINFSKYNGTMAARWGSRGLPDKIIDLASKHQIKTVSLVRTVEEARDALANGYGLSVCSSYGFSNRRDPKGFARKSGSWAHAMAWIACDDTNGEPAFLVQNSWGKWNDGGHPEWGPIPDGSFLIHADIAEGMLRQNGSYAFSNFDGFPLQELPDYGFGDYL
jgi:intein/homing endonuclease